MPLIKAQGDNARLQTLKQERRAFANAADAIIAEIDKQSGKLCALAAPIAAQFRAELANVSTIRNQQCDRLDEKAVLPGGDGGGGK